MNDADRLLTLGAIRQVELQRVATWMLHDLLKQLEDLSDDLAGEVFKHPTRKLTTLRSRTRVERRLIESLEELTQEIMDEIRKRMDEYFEDLLLITEDEEKKNMLLVYGFALVGGAPSPGDLLIGGSPLDEHFDQIQSDLEFRLRNEVRESIAAGEAEEELYWRIKGRETVEGPMGEIAQTKRAVEATVRTAVDSVPSSVQMELDLSKRAGVISPHGWQHISVLDSRTSGICRRRAWKRWDADHAPVGHSIPFGQPPLHANCRSRLQLVFLDDPEPQHLTLSSWVETLSPSQQTKLFGAENIKAWKAGTLSDSELVRQQNRPLSMDDLRARTAQKGDGEFPFL